MQAAPSFPFATALVIANPIAGRGAGRARATEIERELVQRGVATEIYFTDRAGAATRAARDSQVECVVAVGGDGTVAEVLAGLDPKTPLAVFPMGTANVLSNDLELPRSAAGLVAMIGRKRQTPLDVARVNGRLSFLVTGIGVDGAIVRDVAERRRGPLTKWTYVWASLRTALRCKSVPLQVEIDGVVQREHYAWVLVSNLIGYGGFLKLCPQRRLDDGAYEVFLFKSSSLLALAGYALRAFTLGLPGGSCKMVRARCVRVHADTPVPYEVDGDFGGETPLELEVLSEQHTLIIP